MPFAVPKTASLFPDPNWDIQPKTGPKVALENCGPRERPEWRRKAVVASEPQLAQARCLASVFTLSHNEPLTHRRLSLTCCIHDQTAAYTAIMELLPLN